MFALASSQTCPLTAFSAIQSTPVIAPFFAMYPDSTICGAELFPYHLAYAEKSIQWIDCEYPDKWNPNCYRGLEKANERAMAKIFGEIQAAQSDKDPYFAKFAAAMGFEWYYDSEAVTKLPEVPTEKTYLVGRTYYETTYIAVRAEDMTAPVMRGVRRPQLPPYDGRPFFAVKVTDVVTGEVFAQTFNKLFADMGTSLIDWTTHGGVIVQGKGTTITTEHLALLAKLFNGQAVAINGRTLRLACDADAPRPKQVKQIVPTKSAPRVSLCDTISNAILRGLCYLSGGLPKTLKNIA